MDFCRPRLTSFERLVYALNVEHKRSVANSPLIVNFVFSKYWLANILMVHTTIFHSNATHAAKPILTGIGGVWTHAPLST